MSDLFDSLRDLGFVIVGVIFIFALFIIPLLIGWIQIITWVI